MHTNAMKRLTIILLAAAVLAPSMAPAADRYYNMLWAKKRVSRSYDTMVFHHNLPRVQTKRRRRSTRTVVIQYPGGLRVEVPAGKIPPVWVARTLGVATEATAVYAAIRGGNKPAAVAVTALALLGGEAGRTLRDVGKAVGKLGR